MLSLWVGKLLGWGHPLVMMPTIMSSVWTVCLRVRGQQFWGSPHHPEQLQFLWTAFGYIEKLKKE